jgi:diadenosine tetraphosphate (Ap4A) HIT family hydrolase
VEIVVPDEPSTCYCCDRNAMLSDLPPRDAMIVEAGWRAAHTFGTPIIGRLVLLPLRHVESLQDLSSTEAVALGSLLQRLSQALVRVTGCSKAWVMFLAEAPGFAHVHFHIVPRPAEYAFEPGGATVLDFLRSIQGAPLTESRMDEVALQIREALEV